jgi:hypothetical protein
LDDILQQCCLDDILIRNGGNDYSIRHMGKERMLREGILPDRIEASKAAIHTFNFVTNPPRLREDNDANGDANNAAVDNDRQQQPQQMIKTIRHKNDNRKLSDATTICDNYTCANYDARLSNT